MIGKKVRVGLWVVVLVLSVVGSGATSTVMAADGADDDTRADDPLIDIDIGSDGSDTNESDGDNSRSHATEISIGDTVDGTLESENDSDWYAVDLKSGRGATVEVVHTNRVNPTATLSFEMYNPSNDQIGEQPFDRPINAYQTSPASNVAFGADVVKRSGTHYIRVNGADGAKYSLTVNTETLDQHDPNEQPETATRIEPDTTVSGTLTGYDRDLYALDLEAGDNVTITSDASGYQSLWVANSSVSSPMSEEYYFEDLVASAETMDGTLSFTANQTGTYYLKVVTNAEDSTAYSFFEKNPYKMTIDVSEQNDAPDTPTPEPPTEPTETPTKPTETPTTETPTPEPTDEPITDPLNKPLDRSTDTPTNESTTEPTDTPTTEQTDKQPETQPTESQPKSPPNPTETPTTEQTSEKSDNTETNTTEPATETTTDSTNQPPC